MEWTGRERDSPHPSGRCARTVRESCTALKVMGYKERTKVTAAETAAAGAEEEEEEEEDRYTMSKQLSLIHI